MSNIGTSTFLGKCSPFLENRTDSFFTEHEFQFRCNSRATSCGWQCDYLSVAGNLATSCNWQCGYMCSWYGYIEQPVFCDGVVRAAYIPSTQSLGKGIVVTRLGHFTSHLPSYGYGLHGSTTTVAVSSLLSRFQRHGYGFTTTVAVYMAKVTVNPVRYTPDGLFRL